MSRTSRGGERGFTLVEMVVVIAIIATLGGIVYSAMAPARENARRAICMSNLRQIGAAIAMYRSDADGMDVTGGPQTAAQLGLPPRSRMLLPYLRNRQVLHCPDEDVGALFPFLKALETSYTWNMTDLPGLVPVDFNMQVAERGEELPIALCLFHDPHPNPPIDIEGTAFRTLLRLSGRIEGRVSSKEIDVWKW